MIVVVDAREDVKVALVQVRDRSEEPPVTRLGAEPLEPVGERLAVAGLDGPDQDARPVAQLGRLGGYGSSSFLSTLPVGPFGS